MKLKYFFFLFLTLTIIHQTSSIATVRYVSKTGSSIPPYTSWETAADSIQKAVNIADVGDTIYVANGTYYESIYIDKTINLWGSSMDSTIIDGTDTPGLNIVYCYGNSSTLKNFKLTSSTDKRGIYSLLSNLRASFCQLINVLAPLIISSSSVNINNFIINARLYGLRDTCIEDTCHSVYSNNIFWGVNSQETPIYFDFGGKPTFVNNIVIEEGYRLRGVDIQYNSGAIVKNNLVSGYSGINIRVGVITSDTAYLENNISVNSLTAYDASTGNRTIIKNNIAKDSFRGIQGSNGTVNPDYNLFWNLEQLYFGEVNPGDSNIVADPMFVNDTIPRIGGTYDYHLQAYSPAIDKGDPNILDKDGTRSDLGIYGGQLGEVYTYLDLAPLAPRNLTAVVDSNQILVKWNRNTEADTAYYKVYRDTVSGFAIDSTKLISSSPDTFHVQTIFNKAKRYIYKVTCVDNQGNESNPSEEVVVDLTSVSTDDYPMTISDYILYQNYPNPFNPSTKIGYRLKERAYVKLMVYDIKGELISVLVNKEQNAGYYEVDFSVNSLQSSAGNSIASGIYLYRIEVIGSGNIPVFTEMKKMLMIK